MNDISIGDVLYDVEVTGYLVVTKLEKNGDVYVMWDDGSCGVYDLTRRATYRKTNKNMIKDIENMLHTIGEVANE